MCYSDCNRKVTSLPKFRTGGADSGVGTGVPNWSAKCMWHSSSGGDTQNNCKSTRTHAHTETGFGSSLFSHLLAESIVRFAGVRVQIWLGQPSRRLHGLCARVRDVLRLCCSCALAFPRAAPHAGNDFASEGFMFKTPGLFLKKQSPTSDLQRLGSYDY